MKATESKTIVLIHGAFVNNKGWDNWKNYFEGKGYNVIVPSWPHKELSSEELRNHAHDKEIASLRLEKVINHFADIVKGLPEKPIIIGHSMGGLITQVLLNRGLGAAGVAVHSVPPQGVLPTQLSFFRSTYKALGYFTSTTKPYMMSLDTWKYAFTNGMTPEEQELSYNENAAPESKLLVRDGLTSAAHVDFKKEHAPLLILAGAEDNIIPAGLNYSNYKAYKNSPSLTEYKETKGGKNHFVMGVANWQEDADYVYNWINQH